MVCPLTVHQIIGGRLRGVLKQFIPGALVLMVCVAAAVGSGFSAPDLLSLVTFGMASYISVSMVGLYLSVCRIHFLASWILTIVAAIVLPPLLANMPYFHNRPDDRVLGFSLVVIALQLGIAALAWFLLYRRLQRREFALATG